MQTDLKANLPAREKWIVVGTTFVTLGLVLGVWYSYSVFLVAFLREFGWSRSLVAGGFSAFVLVHGAASPFVGWLAGRIGPRRVILVGGCVLAGGLLLTAGTQQWWHLYLAFGVVTAVGITMAGWVPAVVLVRGWFPSRSPSPSPRALLPPSFPIPGLPATGTIRRRKSSAPRPRRPLGRSIHAAASTFAGN